MAGKEHEEYKGIFVYTEEVLGDFEAMYRMKTAISPVTRLVLGLIGLAGVAVFAVLMGMKGFSVELLIPMLFFLFVLALALLMGRKKAESSVERYRKHYLNKNVHVLVDDSGVELKINGQKSYARSKFKDVYSLLETDRTLFLEIKGRAFYILPKDGMEGSTEELKSFIERKCGKRFQRYDVTGVKAV